MIVVTGAAGFIGSALASHVLRRGHEVVIVDNFQNPGKSANYQGKNFKHTIERSEFMDWLQLNATYVTKVFHLGARTDTAEMDTKIFDDLNLEYTKQIWNICTKFQIPLLYASSAATYGEGEYGYEDSHDIVENLKPLNPYGDSKNDFDKWALEQQTCPPNWFGVKFFNVYGPNEYHKGRMASVVYHCFHQIKKNGEMKLFKSHKPNIADGQQSRDFIYIKDVIKMCDWLLETLPTSGLYNIGTGKARSFYDLAASTFIALGIKPNISFIETPADIRDKYQYYTQADMSKLKNAGYSDPCYTLEEGVADYAQNYLENEVIL